MKEIKVGDIVVFTRDNTVKNGKVQFIYPEIDLVVVAVPDDDRCYKVDISDVTLRFEQGGSAETTVNTKCVSITQTEFKELTDKYINLLSDNDIKTAITLFSELLCCGLFGDD